MNEDELMGLVGRLYVQVYSLNKTIREQSYEIATLKPKVEELARDLNELEAKEGA